MNSDESDVHGLTPFWYGALFLPGGVVQGFVAVTLGYILRRDGVSVVAIAGLISLNLLPQTWQFLIGPVVDMSLSGKRWYLISIAAMVASMLTPAFVPLTASGMPLLDAVSLIMGLTVAIATASLASVIAWTVPDTQRGKVAGWTQTGNLGGVGLGGGAGLWLAVHAGGPSVAGLTLAAVCMICATPILWIRAPRRTADLGLVTQAGALGSGLWALLRTRRGILAALVVTLPAGCGAASNLFSAVAGDWRASADMVAAVTGVLGGLATLPGCIIGGYLCDRYSRRVVYVWSTLGCAAGEAAMAWAPHTPVWFAIMVLLNAWLLGFSFAAVSAVVYECLGATAAATIASLLFSLTNLPVVVMVAVVGWVQTRHGSTAMLLVEAGVAAVSITAYSALAYVWRPDEVRGPTVGLAAAEV